MLTCNAGCMLTLWTSHAAQATMLRVCLNSPPPFPDTTCAAREATADPEAPSETAPGTGPSPPTSTSPAAAAHTPVAPSAACAAPASPACSCNAAPTQARHATLMLDMNP